MNSPLGHVRPDFVWPAVTPARCGGEAAQAAVPGVSVAPATLAGEGRTARIPAPIVIGKNHRAPGLDRQARRAVGVPLKPVQRFVTDQDHTQDHTQAGAVCVRCQIGHNDAGMSDSD